MKPHYFTAILFGVSLYWMYLLYAPYLLVITIAALLAISTVSIQNYFERIFNGRFFAAFLSSFLLATLFFAPLGYFLTTLSLDLHSLSIEDLKKIELSVNNFIEKPPVYLEFLKPYVSEAMADVNVKTLTSSSLSIAGQVGAFSAGFLKNAFLVIIFYFFAQYNGALIVPFLQQIVQVTVEESQQLAVEIGDVMSVVFYSILVNAMFQGFLFGTMISFMGYNGLLFGIMYGFASLIPVIGGVLMWLPFMIYELSAGNTSNAIVITLYSIVVISIVADTFVKPLIIKKINQHLLNDNSTRMNELVIFFAIIAGLTTFGFWGMILGPAITAFFLTILKLFEARTQECTTSYKSEDDHP